MSANTVEIAVTGMGALSAHGLGVSALSNALHSGTNPFQQSNSFSMLSFPVIAAELQAPFNFEEAINYFTHLPKKLIDKARTAARRTPLTIQASIFSALEAWQEAHLYNRTVDHTRIGIIVAGQNTTQAYHYNLQKKFHDEPSYLSPTYALHFMDTNQVSTLSEVFDVHGEGFTVGGASASGNVGIIQGCRLIQLGLIDVCLVVGVLADLSPLEIQAFHNIGALGGKHFQDRPHEACRPFDSAHEGFLFGQASACLILESTASAKKSGVPILGTIVGTAMNLDANQLSHPSMQGEIKVIKQALHNAQLSINDIQYINTHGSSSPIGDETEIASIKDVLGSVTKKIWLNSTKSITGHCLWSAGVIEAITTLLQMQQGFVHPNLNLENPIDKHCRFVGRTSESVNIKAALSNAFGFGGINTSIAIKRKENEKCL